MHAAIAIAMRYRHSQECRCLYHYLLHLCSGSSIQCATQALLLSIAMPPSYLAVSPHRRCPLTQQCPVPMLYILLASAPSLFSLPSSLVSRPLSHMPVSSPSIVPGPQARSVGDFGGFEGVGLSSLQTGLGELVSHHQLELPSLSAPSSTGRPRFKTCCQAKQPVPTICTLCDIMAILRRDDL
ncbi:hypothetical protein OH76DRAFT_1406546 [Lentinus brumalis]|uniref:Uncharacterized protein n=1 Tax=Lentinus brumalis TaxID=2498619 RepID=A0A371D343_9APHY|nr:hypothetical protein OH76DRAFT_1406546 [Polyporus brumalis]